MNAQNRAESASIRHEIDHLRHKTVAELKVRYLELFGEASRSNHKQFLIRRIAGGSKLWQKGICRSALASGHSAWLAMPIFV
jgi:thymidylate synthase ThyX